MYNEVWDPVARRMQKQRKTPKEIHGPHLELCKEISRTILQQSDARYWFVWGAHCKDFIREEFRRQQIDRVLGDDNTTPQILHDVVIYGKTKTFICLPHPEYIIRYATQEVLNQICTTLDIFSAFSETPINLDMFVKRLQHNAAEESAEIDDTAMLELSQGLQAVKLDAAQVKQLMPKKLNDSVLADLGVQITGLRRDQQWRLAVEQMYVQTPTESLSDFHDRQLRLLQNVPDSRYIGDPAADSPHFELWSDRREQYLTYRRIKRGILPKPGEAPEDHHERYLALRKVENEKLRDKQASWTPQELQAYKDRRRDQARARPAPTPQPPRRQPGESDTHYSDRLAVRDDKKAATKAKIALKKQKHYRQQSAPKHTEQRPQLVQALCEDYKLSVSNATYYMTNIFEACGANRARSLRVKIHHSILIEVCKMMNIRSPTVNSLTKDKAAQDRMKNTPGFSSTLDALLDDMRTGVIETPLIPGRTVNPDPKKRLWVHDGGASSAGLQQVRSSVTKREIQAEHAQSEYQDDMKENVAPSAKKRRLEEASDLQTAGDTY